MNYRAGYKLYLFYLNEWMQAVVVLILIGRRLGEAMFKALGVLGVVLGWWGASSAHADEVMAVKYACVSCHEIDFLKVGPAYEEVAKKYKGADQQAIDTLVKHVKEGSTGIWGAAMMPAQLNVPDEDVRALVQWILSLDPQ